MKKMISLVVACALLWSCHTRTSSASTAVGDVSEDADASNARSVGAAFADMKYTKIGHDYLHTFSTGNVDAWLNIFADNPVFLWNNGDSLSGKDAIAGYWKSRWSKLDSIRFYNETWVPLRMAEDPLFDKPGTWLLGWYQFDANYKGNKEVAQWAHDAIHFNEQDKVDLLVHYVDMGPIIKAIANQK